MYTMISNDNWKIGRASSRLFFLIIFTGVTIMYVIFVGSANFFKSNANNVDGSSSSATDKDHSLKFDKEESGRPTQVILISTWRAGSSFTGKLLASVPDSFYYFEPIMYLPADIRMYRIRGPPQSNEAIALLRDLLRCNHSLLTVNNGMKRKALSFLPIFNSSINTCGEKMSLCRKPEFTQTLCRKSPFHVLKVVRLHLNLVESLLADNLLSILVLYLVRDPRGILNSRLHAQFTNKYQNTPTIICMDLVTEFYAAKRLRKKFPNQFRVVRYEDLAENPSRVAEEILNFLGHEMHPQVIQFIAQHTRDQQKGTFNLNRNSSYTATRWMQELSFDLIEEIQNDEECQKAMEVWGYKTMTNVNIKQNLVPYLNRSEYNFESFINVEER